MDEPAVRTPTLSGMLQDAFDRDDCITPYRGDPSNRTGEWFLGRDGPGNGPEERSPGLGGDDGRRVTRSGLHRQWLHHPISRPVLDLGARRPPRLATVEINSTGALLDRCANRRGRRKESAATGISERQLLDWANRADLLRISGIGHEFSELLVASGVDTVKALGRRRADNLTAKLVAVNSRRRITRRAPSRAMVERWILGAQKLGPIISH